MHGWDPTVAPTPCANVHHIEIDAGGNDHGVGKAALDTDNDGFLND